MWVGIVNVLFQLAFLLLQLAPEQPTSVIWGSNTLSTKGQALCSGSARAVARRSWE